MTQAATDNKVLACPFCGSFPELVRDKTQNPRHRRVMCVNKLCAVRPATDAAPVNTAASNWNRRLAGSGPDVRDAARGGGAEWVPLPVLRKLGLAAQVLRHLLLRQIVQHHQGEDAGQPVADVGIIHDPELGTWLDVAVQRCLLDSYPAPEPEAAYERLCEAHGRHDCDDCAEPEAPDHA